MSSASSNSVLVRVLHGLAHRGEQLEALFDRHAQPVAVAVNRLALDVLHGDVGITGIADAAIVELRDVRVHQCSQDAALSAETVQQVGSGEARQQTLECDGLPEIGVIPFGHTMPIPP